MPRTSLSKATQAGSVRPKTKREPPDHRSPAITRTNLENVTIFIAAIRKLPKKKISNWPTSSRDENGNLILAMEPEYAPEITALIRACYSNNLIQPFDWGSWQAIAKRYYDEPVRISRADLSTCIKLITFHVRKDRFCGGHFGEMVRSGHITHLLKRLKALSASLPKA